MNNFILYIGNKLASKGRTATTIDTLSKLLTQEGITVYTASSCSNKLLRFLDMLIATIRYSSKVSVVFIDTYSTQNFYYAVAVSKVCRLLRLPYVPILHGGNLPSRLETHSKLSEKLFRNAKVNISPSHYLLEVFKAKGFQNVQYIPNSIPLDDYPFFLRKELQPRLLWVRSFAELYNPMLAVEVVKKLHEKGIRATLTMVGPDKDGSLEKCTLEAEKYNLPIKFTGKMERLEWISLSKAHDIFINTTNFDNTPVSLIEASALGLPIISTNVGGIPYLIEDYKTGILVPPNNAEVFVNAITDLLSNSELAKNLIQNGREKATNFNWQVVKQDWLSLIN